MVVDIQTVSIAVASASIVVAAVYYILQIQHQKKMRQTDLLMRLHLASSTKEFVEAALKYLSTDYKDYDDFVEKYGSLISEGQVQTVFVMMAVFFEGIGVLLKNKLVDIDLVRELFAVEAIWLKLKPVAEGVRKQTNTAEVYEWFEYLYDEVKKREQRGVKNG